MAQNNNDKNFCTGHRQRLRTRYIENGIDSLLEHEILEFILFHSIPRVDTKPLAHRLIDTYGSLKNVFDASLESLKANGLSEISAAHIKLFKDTSGWIRRNEMIGKKVSDYNELGRIVANELDGDSEERLIALMLSNKNEVLELRNVSEGVFKGTKLNMRKLVQCCLDRNAVKVVIAHNHPSGDTRPSAEDNVATTAIEDYLAGVDIELVEHYIVADGSYFGIKRHCKD